MDENTPRAPRPANPQRRKRSQIQIFKETYLPVVIAGAALVLILIFLIGSISRLIQKIQYDKAVKQLNSAAYQEQMEKWENEAQVLLENAELMAAQYDYTGAIAQLDSFTGELSEFPKIKENKKAYQKAAEALVAWDDPNAIPNLTFQLLIADSQRAFANQAYGKAYNRNFVTTGEFSKILQQLYQNGYVLVDLKDFTEANTDADGAVTYKAKSILLPEGKKPIMLTQTNVNYNTYMIDSNGDRLPDKNGAGFASRLLTDENGELICEMVDKDGNTVTGEFDLVPILNSFLKEHPDFSYKGAKAIIAVTGYDGLFGYRSNPGSKTYFGESYYDSQVQGAKDIAAALKEDGYTIACYTYDNLAYGAISVNEIKTDLEDWAAEVTPILGQVDVLVYAQNSDIASQGAYSGDKFNALTQAGFRYFLGFCSGGKPWANIAGSYVRQGRINVSGNTMAYYPQWFEGMFDAKLVLEQSRGTVPN